ncbi:MAG TPA: hypothetical protein PKY37_05000 [Paludibacteraceae bacterium]|nr:hypothetical protein [Paludibacteraceae bacterium]
MSMNSKNLLILVFSVLATLSCVAQKSKRSANKEASTPPVATEAQEAQATDLEVSETCLVNISLFAESAKYKNYADALAPWKAAYAECPQASRAIYTYGSRILVWQIDKEKNHAVKDELVTKLMNLYDDQIKYFGNDEKQPRAYLLGMKAYYSLLYRPTDYKTPYPWLEESVKTLGLDAQPSFLQQFVVVSSELYKADAKHAEKFIQDYLLANEILETNAANEQLKTASLFGDIDTALDMLFVQSGVADCGKLDDIYAPQVQTRQKDYDFLTNTVRFYKRLGCTTSDVFFNAAQYAHNIKPSAESANGCAEMAYTKGDFIQAIEYYKEAVSLATSNVEAADYLYKIAIVYNAKFDNSIKSREYARLSIDRDPNKAAPYILIGMLYANTRGMYDSAPLNKSVYWVAVDKFKKAQQVEPTEDVINKTNELIRTYSRYFPTTEEIFFEPDLEAGKSFFVGGWIGESTICR